MKFSIEGDNNGSTGALGNNLTELKNPLLSNIERMDALLLRAKSTASCEAQQYEELRQIEEARIGMLAAQLQEKEESLRTKETAIKQLEESLTAKTQELEHRHTEKEDLTSLLERRTSEITDLRSETQTREALLQEKEESLRAKDSVIKQLEESLTAKIQELEHRFAYFRLTGRLP